ncbi:hypothetical protein CJF32_00000476 [Rutstroemia sp. NJR-2017a WRK4]|nr:hypothetical protein CJF32_00000476 [Rutstroemia sp. NJR-2017a WRK4]
MGQRHQLFVIAKIGNRYRGLAAVHHQYLYGYSAIKICLNLIKIFQCPANRWALKHELQSATRVDEAYWSKEDAYVTDVDDIPFPFITTCLSVGSSLRPDEASHAVTHVLSFNMPYDGGANNNGITVLDITDLENVRYCFVDFHGMESEGDVDLMTPLSATTYLRAYETVQGKVEDYERLPLIDGRALYSAWPDSKWRVKVVDDKGNYEWRAVKNMDPEELNIQGFGPALDKLQLEPSTRATLRSSTLIKTIQAAFESPESDLPGILESASLLGDFYATVKKMAYDDPAIVIKSASARRILSTALKNDTSIDLTPFSELSSMQIMDILKERSTIPDGLDILNLSGNRNLTEETLKEIISTFPGLKTLRLLGTPQIPLANKVQLLQGTTIQLFDSEQFALPFIIKKDDHALFDRMEKWVPRDKPLYGYIKPIIQQVLIMSCGFATRDEDGTINIKESLKNGITGQAWSCIPLEEVNLTPPLLISGVVQYLHYLLYLLARRAYHDLGTSNPVAINLSKQLAMPSFLDGSENSTQIHPICEYLYKTPRDSFSLSTRGGWWKHRSKILPGEWTLVLLGTGNNALNCSYAFVTAEESVQQQPSSDSNPRLPTLIIETFEGFLDRHSLSAEDKRSVLRVWATATELAINKGVVSLMDRPQLESMLRALMYPEVDPESESETYMKMLRRRARSNQETASVGTPVAR